MSILKRYYKDFDSYIDELKIYRTVYQFDIIESLKNKYIDILEIWCYGWFLLQKLSDNWYNSLYWCDCLDLTQSLLIKNMIFNIWDLSKKLPYADDKFDLVVASHVLEHVYDVENAICEIKRICKKDWNILFDIPLDLNLASRLKILFKACLWNPFSVWGHIKFFNPKLLENMLIDKYKFNIVEKTYKWLWYGKLDLYFWKFSKLLANLFPSNMAWSVVYLLKNIK